MLRNGRFQGIVWDNLAEEHKKYWLLLRKRYGFHPIEGASGASGDSLDTIAQRSIRSCAAQLWEKWNVQQPSYNSVLPNLLASYLEEALCDHLIVTFAYRFYCENLETAPRDRYWRKIQDATEVYSDASNFHKKYGSYENNLESIVKKYKELLAADLSNAEHSLEARQKNLQQMIKDVASDKLIESGGTTEHHRESCIQAELLANAHEVCTLEKETLTTQKQLVEGLLSSLNVDFFKKEGLFAPGWIFAFAMATNWKKSPLRVKEGEFGFILDGQKMPKRNQLVRLTDFIGNNEWSRLLLKQEKNSIPLLSYIPAESQRKHLLSQTASIMEFRVPSNDPESSPDSEKWEKICDVVLEASIYPAPRKLPPVNPTTFVGLAFNSGGEFPQGLPAQEYNLKITRKGNHTKGETVTEKSAESSQSDSSKAETVIIPPEIQYVFNSYLLEQNFHGYAVATVMNCIAARPPQQLTNEQLERYVKMIRVTRLHAPFVHASLIRLLAQEITAGRDVEWVDSYITYLNEVSLPILEEAFLCNVYHAYASCPVEVVFKKIEESFLGRSVGKDGILNTEIHMNLTVKNKGFPQITSAVKEILQERARQALRCNRLVYYRLIPKGKDHCSTYSKDFNYLVDRIVMGGYVAGMGNRLLPTVVSEGELMYNPGVCTAFDD